MVVVVDRSSEDQGCERLGETLYLRENSTCKIH